MKIKKHLIEEMTIEEFADRHDLVMEVHERDSKTLAWFEESGHASPSDRYWASFEHSETLDGGVLTSAFGNGSTIESAILDYAQHISECLLVIHAYDPTSRREIRVPRLVEGK